MAMTEPDTLHAILSAVADAVGTYVGYQIDAGAQCVQIFDSWGGQLQPHMWEVWSKPYIQRVVDKVRASHPGTPLTLYANGSGGLLERMATTGVDCIGLDWTIDMEDGRRRVGDKAVQGNVDPAVLFAPPEARSSITLIPVRPRRRGERRSLRTFSPGVRYSQPRVPRFQS